MTSCKRSLIESRITRVTNRTHHSYSVMADMEDALAVAVDKAVRNFFPKVKELSCQQFEIMKSIFILQKDTFAVLPTGHGKSLPFQIAPFVAKELGPLKEFDFVKTKDIILIIPPLLVIMDMQAKTLNSVGIPACCLHDESLDADEISSGEKFRVIFGTPEAWVKTDKWRNMLRSTMYQERVLLLVADEAHCVPEW